MASVSPVRIPLVRLGATRVPLPEYFSAGAAGMDLAASLPEPVVLGAGHHERVAEGPASLGHERGDLGSRSEQRSHGPVGADARAQGEAFPPGATRG